MVSLTRNLRRGEGRGDAVTDVGGALAVAGGLAHGAGRPIFWSCAVGVDLLGGAVGFYTPWLGRSTTADWTISVHHMAERCQAFVLIALGESVVLIGSTLAGLQHVPAAAVAAFVAAFAGVAGLWWVYFDRSAAAAAEVVAGSPDPGRLGRSAYHFVHPIMVAGIIVTAAADERVLPIRRRPRAVLQPGSCSAVPACSSPVTLPSRPRSGAAYPGRG